MKRREFVVWMGQVAVVLPATAGALLAGCGGGDAGPDDGEPGTPPPSPQGALTVTSSVNIGHTHTVTVQRVELDQPPAGGVQRNTSLVNGHVHELQLSEDDLRMIADGGSVSRTTSTEDGHTHTFDFALASG